MTDPMLVVIGGALFAIGILISVLPVGECKQCPHCRHRKVREREDDTQRRHHAWHLRYGDDDCPYCDGRR